MEVTRKMKDAGTDVFIQQVGFQLAEYAGSRTFFSNDAVSMQLLVAQGVVEKNTCFLLCRLCTSCIVVHKGRRVMSGRVVVGFVPMLCVQNARADTLASQFRRCSAAL